MALSDIENRYLDRLAEQQFPTMPVEPEGTVRPGAMAGEMSAIEQTTGEKVMEGIGTTLERAGQMMDQGKTTELGRIFSVIDEWVPGTLNEITGKQIPIIGDMRLRDLMPFVGGTEQVQDPMTGEMMTKEVGTPQAFKMAGRGESLTTGTGFTTQLKSDPKLAALELGMTVAPVIKPAVGKLAEVGREMATIPPTGAVQLFQSTVTKASQKVDKGSVRLSDKVANEQLLQLQPQYRVKVIGAYKPEGGMQNITNAINPGNYQEMSGRLDELATAFPDPLESPERFSSMMATVYNSNEVPIPPRWLIKNANNVDEWAGWFGKMTPNQISEAGRGFSIVDKFKTIYGDGTATADTTGRLMMWAMLSRRVSAYPHESGFLDLAEQMTPLIQKAVRGEYTEADVDAGLALIQKYIPKGSPGKSVTSNANDFVRTFLVKMSDKMPDGRTKLQALHDMIADPNMTGPQIRRAFYGLADSVGIKNKVLSFALLVSGRTDVMVLDRIQINRLFGDGNKIYDDVAQIFDGGPGLAMYEGMERSIERRIKELYAKVGRPNDASLGRYHWESWVLSSGQEVAHPTLETMVKAAKGEASPYLNVPVMEGRTHKTAYGVKYQRLPGGKNQFVYSASDGAEYAMTKDQLDSMLKSVMTGKQKLVPKDFPGVNYFEQDVLPDGSPNPYFGKPWYTWPGVDKDGIDKRAAEYGTRINPSSGGEPVAAAVGSSVTDGPGRSRRTSTVKRGQASAKGAE